MASHPDEVVDRKIELNMLSPVNIHTASTDPPPVIEPGELRSRDSSSGQSSPFDGLVSPATSSAVDAHSPLSSVSGELTSLLSAEPDKFRESFRNFVIKFCRILVFVAAIEMVASSVSLGYKWNTPPGWLSRVPCFLQESFEEFEQLVLRSLRFLEFLNILVALGALIFCIHYLRHERKQNLREWYPPHLGYLSLIFCLKIACAFIMFTAINYKLPIYAPYDRIYQKSCEISIGNIFSPLSGIQGLLSLGELEQIGASDDHLRQAAIEYFQHPKNWKYPAEKEFESSLTQLNSSMSNAKKPKCIYNRYDEDDKLYSSFKDIGATDPAISNYCQAGLAAAQRGNDAGFGIAEFPVTALLEQLKIIVQGLALAYYGCGTDAPVADFPINDSLTFSDVCEKFYQQSTDPAYTVYFTGAGNISSAIDGLEYPPFTLAFKEAACMYLANIGDPKTGRVGFEAVLCNSRGNTTDFEKRTAMSMAQGPVAAGFDFLPRDWLKLSEMLFVLLNYSLSEDNLDPKRNVALTNQVQLLRWVMNDVSGIGVFNSLGMDMLSLVLIMSDEVKVQDILTFLSDQKLSNRVLRDKEIISIAESILAKLAFSNNKVRYLIGTFIGFMAVSNLVPFAISIITGVARGIKSFAEIIKNSQAVSGKEDTENIKSFTSLIILLTALITTIPILVIPIFVYQSYANQYFVITILGVMLYCGSSALAGYHAKWSLAVNVVAVIMMILGMVLWVIYDEDKLLLQALLFQNPAYVIAFIINFIFNFVFSNLIACNVIGYLTARMFERFDTVHYHSPQGSGYEQSKLAVLNVWKHPNTPPISHSGLRARLTNIRAHCPCGL